MSEPDTPAEHLCVLCPILRPAGKPRRPIRMPVCDGCRTELPERLGSIPANYAALPDNLEPGKVEGGRGGGFESRLPVNVGALNLLGPGSAGLSAIGEHETQIGELPAVVILDHWVRDWIEYRNMREKRPEPTVDALIQWLTLRVDWAMNEHLAVDKFAAHMMNLLRALRRTVGVTDVKPESLDVPCRRCDLVDLHRLPGEDRVECGSCGDLLTEDEYRRWCGLLAAGITA